MKRVDEVGLIWTSRMPASVLASGMRKRAPSRSWSRTSRDAQVAQLADADAAAAERLDDRAAAGVGRGAVGAERCAGGS